MMMMMFYMIGLILFFEIGGPIYLVSFSMLLLILFLLMNYEGCLDWYFMSFNLGINIYSFWMVMLILWVMSMILMSIKLSTNSYMNIMNILLFLTLVMLMIFISMDFMMFYFFFEASLILIFLVVMYWGGPMRYAASFYLMFYTLFFSLPLLMMLLYYIDFTNASLFKLMEFFSLDIPIFFYLYMLMTFLVKIPVFLLHSWLLKAHVEAPVYGSMVLAAIMLKLGTYGLLRFVLIFYEKSLFISSYMVPFSLIGGIVMSLTCLRQLDMKLMVAYSSIVHMSLLIASTFTLTKLGFLGSYMMMLAHGLCSSGMFYMVNIFYERSHSRLLVMNKGILGLSTSMALMWFLLCSSNMPIPISLNLIGEIMMVISLYVWSSKIFFLLIYLMFFSFFFSLYLFSYIQHGKSILVSNVYEMNVLEYFVVLMHWVPLNLLFLKLDLF